MHRSRRQAWLMLLFSLAALSCALPAITLQDPAGINTAAAQTVIAGLTQAALSALPSLIPSGTPYPSLTATLETPTPTYSMVPPTATPTASITATTAFSPTPITPQISVSLPTNCRSGPGKTYALTGALLVGETAQVYGRDPTGNYWYIRNPDAYGEFCWVWGKYATLWGNTALLPIYTPPPTPIPTVTSTPAPAFQASYEGMDYCTNWWLEIKLKNTGSLSFRSMSITVKDLATDVVHTKYTDTFTNRTGCDSTITRDALAAGKSFIISAPGFNYDLTGHKVLVTISLCSQAGQSGTCVTRSLKFKP